MMITIMIPTSSKVLDALGLDDLCLALVALVILCLALALALVALVALVALLVALLVAHSPDYSML